MLQQPESKQKHADCGFKSNILLVSGFNNSKDMYPKPPPGKASTVSGMPTRSLVISGRAWDALGFPP